MKAAQLWSFESRERGQDPRVEGLRREKSECRGMRCRLRRLRGRAAAPAKSTSGRQGDEGVGGQADLFACFGGASGASEV
jgi:hypothetical protein